METMETMGLEMLLRTKFEDRDEGRLGEHYFHPTRWLHSIRAHCSVAPSLPLHLLLVLQARK